MPLHKQIIRQAKSPQRKLNLARKRLAAAGGTRAVWYICKKQDNKMYYLADFDSVRKVALWCIHRADAHHFHTESGLQFFIADNLNNRKDLILVQAQEPNI